MSASLTIRAVLAATAAAKWRRVYLDEKSGEWRHGGRDKQATYMRLCELGPNPAPDEVDRVIGNGSWTECECDDCGKKCDAVADVGDPSSGEYRQGRVCLDCLREAVAALEALR